MSAAPDDLALLISDLRPGENELERRAADAIDSLGERLEEANNRAARAEVAIEALQRQLAEAEAKHKAWADAWDIEHAAHLEDERQLSEARAAQSELVDLVKQAVAPLSDEIEDLTRQLSASRAAEERMRAENARLVEELAETRENLEEEERSVSIYFAETQAAKAALVAMEKAKNEYATLAHERGKEVERLRAALQRLDPALGTS